MAGFFIWRIKTMTGRKFFSDLLKYADTYGQGIISKYERGLLTNREAENMIIDLYKSHLNTTDRSIKEWYIKAFPDDEVGQEINDHITFEEAYHALKTGNSFYKVVGDHIDTVIRERIFTEMSYLFKVSYDEIYNLWIDAEKRRKP
jgi:hypothetical protein